MSSKSGQFRVAGKAKKLGLDSFVRSVTTVFMHGTIVDKEAFPRHPVRRSEHHHIRLPLFQSSPYLLDGGQRLAAMVIGFVPGFKHGKRMGQKNSAKKSARLRRRRFVNGLRFNATKFALTPLREVGQSPFSI